MSSQLMSSLLPSLATVHQLADLCPVLSDEVARILARTTDMSSAQDVIPTWLLKKLTGTMSPLIAKCANISIKARVFQTEFKTEQVTPILKNSGYIPTDDLASYRPISNLNTISKILEKLALGQITSHLKRSNYVNVDIRQSAYVNGRSTERSLLCLHDDLHWMTTITWKTLSSDVLNLIMTKFFLHKLLSSLVFLMRL